ncbi:MAG: DUF2225 domain-containing protein [Muribaculaceae bacterium]|nr:DUF2225 domain-containing protein [Muribaculaceae bacterium]
MMKTKTVTTVKIFLASSNELHDDRVAFSDFIMRLQKHYEPRNYHFQVEKWEYLNPAYNNRRKQDEYNQALGECDSFVALFYTKTGKYTVEEFDEAIKECKKREYPLLIYFKTVKGEKETPKIKKLKKRIDEELEHFWGEYDTNDKLHLDFALWLDSFLFDGKSELKVESGEVSMDGVKVAEMSQLPFAKNNKKYQSLNDKIAKLNQEIEQIQQDINDYPSDKQSAKLLNQKFQKRYQYQKKLEEQQKAFLGAAKRFAETDKEQVNKKLQEAKKAFDDGRLDMANRLLDQIENDAESHLERLDQERAIVHQDIEALLVKTQTVMADTEKPIEERIKRIAEIYAKADDWAKCSAYDDKKYAQLLLDFAGFLRDYAFYEQAIDVYLRQIAMSEKLYGTDSKEIATSYNNIGLAYWDQGEYGKALEFHKKALDIDEKKLGKEHPDTATDYNNIGAVYKSQCEYDKALEFNFKALDIREKVLGKEHPQTATCYNNIGLVYKRLGKYDKALEYYFKALDIDEKALGKEHPDTAIDYNNIGWVYREQGDYKKALEYYEKAYEIRKIKLGEKHPDTKDVALSIEIMKEKMKK